MDDKLTKAFTIVFAGDIRDYQGNQFKVDSPWGRPVSIAMGNALEELDEIEAREPPTNCPACGAGPSVINGQCGYCNTRRLNTPISSAQRQGET